MLYFGSFEEMCKAQCAPCGRLMQTAPPCVCEYGCSYLAASLNARELGIFFRNLLEVFLRYIK